MDKAKAKAKAQTKELDQSVIRAAERVVEAMLAPDVHSSTLAAMFHQPVTMPASTRQLVVGLQEALRTGNVSDIHTASAILLHDTHRSIIFHELWMDDRRQVVLAELSRKVKPSGTPRHQQSVPRRRRTQQQAGRDAK